MLIKSQLYYKPSDKLKDLNDQAANNFKRVIIVEVAFPTIKRIYEMIGPYINVNKTFIKVQR